MKKKLVLKKTAPTVSPKAARTHGFTTIATNDGVKRAVSVGLFEDGNYEVVIETWWPDVTKSVKTILALSSDTYSMLASALLEGAHNMRNWVVPPKT